MPARFYAALFLLAGFVGVAHAQDSNNLLTDGYFTNASGTSDSDWGYVGPGSEDGGFTTTYTSNSVSGGDFGQYGNYLTFSTPYPFLEADASGPGFATSLFKSTPGQDLTITFDAQVEQGSALIGVLQGSAIDGVVVSDPVQDLWNSYTITTTNGASAFIFENLGVGSSPGLTIDIANIDIIPTPSGSPEPFTMGIGIAGICFAARRRMKAKNAS